MFCKNCGNLIEDGADSCISCGMKVEVEEAPKKSSTKKSTSKGKKTTKSK